jgi:hypothetical protein
MKVLTQGHKYELENFENKDNPGQIIQFIEKVPDGKGDGTLVTVNDGTTNEEVIAVLIDRLTVMNGKLPNRDTSIAITHLEDALMRLEKRTRDRKKAGVEGTMRPTPGTMPKPLPLSVVINGVKHWPLPVLRYEEIVTLAGKSGQPDVTVKYPDGKRLSVLPGQCASMMDGTVVNCIHTGNA